MSDFPCFGIIIIIGVTGVIIWLIVTSVKSFIENRHLRVENKRYMKKLRSLIPTLEKIDINFYNSEINRLKESQYKLIEELDKKYKFKKNY